MHIEILREKCTDVFYLLWFFFFFLSIYFFWLHHALGVAGGTLDLVAACKLLVVACGI